MRRWMVVLLAVLVLFFGSVVPSHAWARGGGHFHGGGGWWGPGAFIGGLALGTALAYPYYAYPYPVYSPPVVVEQPPVVYQQPAVHQPPVQREVVYPHGKYVLYGDGVTQAWQWVWIPAAPPPPPPR